MINHKKNRTIHYASFLSGLLLLASSASANNLFYDFIAADTGEVVATFEFTSLPASPTEIVSLTFSPAGQAIAGFGQTYSGVNDFQLLNSNLILDDGSQGLAGDAYITDYLPPTSAVFPTVSDVSFHFVAAPGLDRFMIARTIVGNLNLSLYGDWKLQVPEPSAMVLSVLSLIGFSFRRVR